MAIPIKGSKDIRTQAGLAGGKREAYHVYMEVSALERERSRREKERATALQLVAKLDARCAEIDARKARLLAEAAAAFAGGRLVPADRLSAVKARREAVIAKAPPASQGFRIRY